MPKLQLVKLKCWNMHNDFIGNDVMQLKIKPDNDEGRHQLWSGSFNRDGAAENLGQLHPIDFSGFVQIELLETNSNPDKTIDVRVIGNVLGQNSILFKLEGWTYLTKYELYYEVLG